MTNNQTEKKFLDLDRTRSLYGCDFDVSKIIMYFHHCRLFTTRPKRSRRSEVCTPAQALWAHWAPGPFPHRGSWPRRPPPLNRSPQCSALLSSRAVTLPRCSLSPPVNHYKCHRSDPCNHNRHQWWFPSNNSSSRFCALATKTAALFPTCSSSSSTTHRGSGAQMEVTWRRFWATGARALRMRLTKSTRFVGRVSSLDIFSPKLSQFWRGRLVPTNFWPSMQESSPQMQFVRELVFSTFSFSSVWARKKNQGRTKPLLCFASLSDLPWIDPTFGLYRSGGADPGVDGGVSGSPWWRRHVDSPADVRWRDRSQCGQQRRGRHVPQTSDPRPVRTWRQQERYVSFFIFGLALFLLCFEKLFWDVLLFVCAGLISSGREEYIRKMYRGELLSFSAPKAHVPVRRKLKVMSSGKEMKMYWSFCTSVALCQRRGCTDWNQLLTRNLSPFVRKNVAINFSV